jgi:2-polyprenyl-6-methoxyphenol hydroxylase-like FAD-dependent oxidoreductase
MKKAEALGIRILRGYKASSLTDKPKGLVVGFENGHTITTKYLVGADGAQSTVREV